MLSHRNIGAPFTRDDGSRWKRGEVKVPTAEELRRKAYKLRPLPDASRIFLHEHPPTPRTPAGVEAPGVNTFSNWPLEMLPERYLELYPTGPNAELAHRILGTESDGTALPPEGDDTEDVEEAGDGADD